jgi:hypothetical protein
MIISSRFAGIAIPQFILEVKDSMKKKRIEAGLADDVRKLQQFGLKITTPCPDRGFSASLRRSQARISSIFDSTNSARFWFSFRGMARKLVGKLVKHTKVFCSWLAD